MRGWTVVDETHIFTGVTPMESHGSDITDDNYNLSRIQSVVRVTLNRSLTWAERNYFWEVFNDDEAFVGWIWKEEGRVLYLSSELDSRSAVDDISSFVEREYLNVFPKSVWTIYPEIRV